MRISDWSSDVCSSDLQSLDPTQRRITIAHGPIPTMNWPAMTMTFGVRQAEMLRGFKRGDRVDFAFPKEQQGGAYVIEQLSRDARSEEHTSELQSLMRISYAVFCLKKKKKHMTCIKVHTDKSENHQ